jgi:hypothetical protein
MPINDRVHPWLKTLSVTCVTGTGDPLSNEFLSRLVDHLQQEGHRIQVTPDEDTDVILTTAAFGEALNWREALMFTARRRCKLKTNPTVFSDPPGNTRTIC